jgi:hypothetical protein
MKNEDRIQQEIFVWFNNTYCLKNHKPRGIIFSIPNGGTRNAKEAVKLKATGLLRGASDLIVILPNGKLLFIEVKTDIGVQSEYQKDFEDRVKSLGFEYILVRSLEEFKKIINSQ